MGIIWLYVPMYIEKVPNRNSKPTILLREAYRKGKKVIKRTIANLTDWPEKKILYMKRVLNGEPILSPEDIFQIKRSLPHGNIMAILGTIKNIGLDKIIYSSRTRTRDLVLAMIVERLIYPCSKLKTTRLWQTTTLAEELNLTDATEDDLYSAMDWLVEQQERIEKNLASKHLSSDTLALYDVSSSYYEGKTCKLARYGHNRDGKNGLPIIVYGMMVDSLGRPIALEVYPGNTGDPTTIVDQVEKLRKQFGLEKVILVGDRGLITQTQINYLKEQPGIGWITALRSSSIRKLVAKGNFQLELFDKMNLAEISSDEFPGERLVVCFNPLVAEERKRKREELIIATEKKLNKIINLVLRRKNKILDRSEIGKRVGRILNSHKVGKHFKINISDGLLSYSRNIDTINKEALLDGIYIIRTSESQERMIKEDIVRNYKSLSLVERAFRSLKGINIMIRPIFHREDRRVKAHMFICMLAYYVEWHMCERLGSVLFNDEEARENRNKHNPVLPVKPSQSAIRKKKTHLTLNGEYPVHSFDSLLMELVTYTRNLCSIKNDKEESEIIYRYCEPTPFQKMIFDLLKISVPSC